MWQCVRRNGTQAAMPGPPRRSRQAEMHSKDHKFEGIKKDRSSPVTAVGLSGLDLFASHGIFVSQLKLQRDHIAGVRTQIIVRSASIPDDAID